MVKNETVLNITNLTKNYGKRVAVNNISFSLEAGEIVGFLGPNGARKTTTIKMITGLTKITSGTVEICGHSIQKDFENAIRNIGAIIEGPDMYGYLSGYENLKFYASISDKNISKKHIDNIVKIVGLSDRIHDKVKNYSLGMKQRLGIAQSLLNVPKILILDEPTNGLDPEGIKDIRNLLKRLASEFKITVLISSHNLKEMQDICDKVIIINEGNILGIKTINALNDMIDSSGVIEVVVNYPNFASKVIMFSLRTKVEISGRKIIFTYNSSKIPEIISLLTHKGIDVYGINSTQQNLEDLYFRILNNQKV